MTRLTWEDLINPTDHDDVLAERDRAYAEQRAMIEAIRGTIADVPRSARRYTPRVAPQPEPEPEPEPAPPPPTVSMDHYWTAERVIRLRNALKMSQREMAEVLRVQKGTVSRWEIGIRTPRHGTVKDELLALEQRVKARDAA
jgi:DNA-binding XRE family transcriptional regulator